MSGYRSAVAAWAARVGQLDDLEPGARVVVACSGGADSLALLALSRARGLDATAVYVDHGLRPGTDHDVRVVRAAADAVGAEVQLATVTVAPGSNLEARARDARYAALELAAAGLDARAILVGHTRDDQAETVLLAMLRGSGATGLAGMPAVRGRVRRPLLELRRAETREICARLGWSPVNDPMNDETHYRRIWLRRELIPQLARAARRDIVDVLARQAALLRDDDEYLDAVAAEHDATDARALTALRPAIARRVVRRWLGPPPPDAAVVDAVLAVAREDRRAVELPGGRRVERVGARLHLLEPAGRGDAPPASLPVPGRACFGALTVETWIDDAAPVVWPDGRTCVVADADRVGADVVVRSARAGERFRPLGSGGSKLVRDALAEAGVPASARTGAPVVSAGLGAAVAPDSPLWVVGYRIDDRVRVTSQTRRYVWMSVGPC